MSDTEVQVERLRRTVRAFRILPASTDDFVKREIAEEIVRFAEELRDRAFSLYCGKCKEAVTLTPEQWEEIDTAGRENIEVTCERCEPALAVAR